MKLDQYQIDAVDRLKTGSILCGGVGSGKSRTALAYYLKTAKDKPLLIITTAAKRDKHEWEDDLKECGIEDSFKIDSWNNISKYKTIKGHFVIFDEQRLVGSGVWVKSFYKLAAQNDWILLTATPGDTWSDYIAVFIANGFFRTRTEFLATHAVYSRYTKYPKIERYIGEARLMKFRRQILVNMDYKSKAKHEYISVPVQYIQLIYRTLMKTRKSIKTGEPVQNAAELCYELRYIVNSDESRAEEVLRICETHEKLIIFYNFNYELDILRSLSYPEGTEIAEWNGKKHEQVPRSKRWVYLVQYTAGCEGWNCISTNAMTFYSLNYSYRVMTQAKGRIDRRNTPFDTLYYYQLRSRAPIDLAISLALSKKKTFNEQQFCGNAQKKHGL